MGLLVDRQKQCGDIRFGLRIVAFAPTRMINGFLKVDNE